MLLPQSPNNANILAIHRSLASLIRRGAAAALRLLGLASSMQEQPLLGGPFEKGILGAYQTPPLPDAHFLLQFSPATVEQAWRLHWLVLHVGKPSCCRGSAHLSQRGTFASLSSLTWIMLPGCRLR